MPLTFNVSLLRANIPLYCWTDKELTEDDRPVANYVLDDSIDRSKYRRYYELRPAPEDRIVPVIVETEGWTKERTVCPDKKLSEWCVRGSGDLAMFGERITFSFPKNITSAGPNMASKCLRYDNNDDSRYHSKHNNYFCYHLESKFPLEKFIQPRQEYVFFIPLYIDHFKLFRWSDKELTKNDKPEGRFFIGDTETIILLNDDIHGFCENPWQRKRISKPEIFKPKGDILEWMVTGNIRTLDGFIEFSDPVVAGKDKLTFGPRRR